MDADIVIARNTKLLPIKDVAATLGISEDDIEFYGKYKAKINVKENVKGKLILVTAINPTASGEGKTTVSIGLADSLKYLGKKVCLALREPSLGPVFGIKGGATGGGYSQVAPMDDINLHFTGDLHAITTANNLLAAMIDNHIFQGNVLELDPENIYFHRCMDMNDRALRNITVGQDGQSTPRTESFCITAASEIMAILCLAKDFEDLKNRLANISIGLNKKGEVVKAKELHAEGSMATLLKDAIKPNLVQTLYHTPAIIHGGPFANIAHGCNTIIATKAALSLADYVVTEAGFGADLGAEKFLDVKCRVAGLEPGAIVLVATARALKLHGGAKKEDLAKEDLVSLKNGIPNLIKHIENIVNVYKKPVVVAINRFPTDTENELALIGQEVEKLGVDYELCEGFLKGEVGATKLAEKVLKAVEKPSKLQFSYNIEDDIKTKIYNISTKIYGADGVEYSDLANEKIKTLEKLGTDKLPVVIAKTQYSLSDDPTLLSRPQNFKILIRDVELRSGAGFIVAIAGKIMLMPGLPKRPAAEGIDINLNGEISGLF